MRSWLGALRPNWQTAPRGWPAVAWGTLILLSFAANGPKLARALLPLPGEEFDFVQEWLSARNYWHGYPVYEDMTDAYARHVGIRYEHSQAAYYWNAHPPCSVLIALPFGWMPEYRWAHFLWNLLSFGAFVGAVGLVLHELSIKFTWSVGLSLCLIALNAYPIQAHLVHGQLNFVLAALLVLGWQQDRRGNAMAAGLCVGLAAALKLFPALAFGYFLFASRWKSLAWSLMTLTLFHLLALLAFGWPAFEAYLNTIMPSVSQYRFSYYIMSLTGIGARLARDTSCSQLIQAVTLLTQLAILAVIAWRAGMAQSIAHRDRAYCLAVTALPLLSPLCWSHYLVVLVLPLLWLWSHIEDRTQRLIFLTALTLLMLHDGFFLFLQDNFYYHATFQDSLQYNPRIWLSGEPFFLSLLILFVMMAFCRVGGERLSAVEPA